MQKQNIFSSSKTKLIKCKNEIKTKFIKCKKIKICKLIKIQN